MNDSISQHGALKAALLVALLLSGAIFGFFYAWVCSTMWGLDAADPRVAIQAMQAMNASVRNAVFAPAFFGTGPVLLAVAFWAGRVGYRDVAVLLALGGVAYIIGGMGLTMAVNVPMNEALAVVDVPEGADAAAEVWQAYSGRWQVFNLIRTVVSGLVLLLTGAALIRLR